MDVLAEWGSNSLEFGVLSRATGDSRYQFEAERVLRHVHSLHPNEYLLPRETNRFTGQISTHLWGIGNGAWGWAEAGCTVPLSRVVGQPCCCETACVA